MPFTIRVEEQVDAPPERVFALSSDFATMTERIPDIKRVEMLTEGPVRVGTRFKETRVMFGKEATETMEVTAFDPPRGYNLGANSCGCIYDSRIDVVPNGGGSNISITFTGTPTTFFAKMMAPIGKLFSGTLRKCLARDLEALKAAAESRA